MNTERRILRVIARKDCNVGDMLIRSGASATVTETDYVRALLDNRLVVEMRMDDGVLFEVPRVPEGFASMYGLHACYRGEKTCR